MSNIVVSDQKKQALKATAGLLTKYARTLAGDDRAMKYAATLSSLAQNDPKFYECTPDSVIAGMMACVHLDLMPNTPEQDAFLIPRKIHGVQKVTFQLGYKGLIKLGYRSGVVMAMGAELVFPEDEFEVIAGSEQKLIHKPNYDIDRTKFGDVTRVYAWAHPTNGGKIFDVMSMSELEKVRETVQAKSTDAPWQKWPEAMAKKTVLKRMSKFLPSSAENNSIQLASQYDSWAEAGKLKASEDGQLKAEENITEALTADDQTKADNLAKAKSAMTQEAEVVQPVGEES